MIAHISGEIAPQNIYTQDEAMQRLGWSRVALAAARRRGLKTRKSGKRCYILGRDIIEFLTRDTATESQPEPAAT